jgi:hypothetical protein
MPETLIIAAGVKREGPLGLHGHANIGITLDRYGDLMPGDEAEAAGLLDGYLSRNVEAVLSRDGLGTPRNVPRSRRRRTGSIPQGC